MKMIMMMAMAVSAMTAVTGCTGERSGAGDATIRVGSYNIRFETNKDAPLNTWDLRKEALVETVKNMKLDVFGMQEVMYSQEKYLCESLPEFVRVGHHTGSNAVKSGSSPLFYRASRFNVEKQGTFWLSETPEIIGSRSWKTACTRVCTYIVATDKLSGKRLCFANTHLDHRSSLARKNGMELILKRLKEYGKGCTVVLTGDHNCREIHEPAILAARELDNAFLTCETTPRGPWRTLNWFNWQDNELQCSEALKLPVEVRNDKKRYDKFNGARIDYIYVTRGTRVLDFETVNTPRKGLQLYPSDHYPIAATIELK